MADKKISALTSATTPLAGTEVLPIVQGGATVKVTVDNLTAGKTVSLSNLTFTGTGNRITGDTNNATVSSRLFFQSSTTNGSTSFSVLPNGTSLVSGYQAYNNSDPTNAAFAQLATSAGTEVRLASGISGTGTYLPMTFYTGGSERMRIESGGGVRINNTSNATFSAQLNTQFTTAVQCGMYLKVTNTSAAQSMMIFGNTNSDAVGAISTDGATTSYATSSDYRLKKDIAPMTGALAKVALLKPCTYKWKFDGSDGQGFIAHELDEVVPGCVTGEKDAVQEEQYEITPAVKDEKGNTITAAVMGTRIGPKYQGIDTSFLVATLTAAIQEQQALIQALTTRITALEAA